MDIHETLFWKKIETSGIIALFPVIKMEFLRIGEVSLDKVIASIEEKCNAAVTGIKDASNVPYSAKPIEIVELMDHIEELKSLPHKLREHSKKGEYDFTAVESVRKVIEPIAQKLGSYPSFQSYRQRYRRQE